MSAIEINVKNVDGIVASLKALPASVASNAVRKAVKIAGEPIEGAMANRAPVRFGILRNSLTTQLVSLRDKLTFVCRVGVRSKVSVPIDIRTRGKNKGEMWSETPTRYVKVVEFGSSTREATPFMRPALRASARNAVGAFTAEMENQIDAAVEKVAFKYDIGTVPTVPRS